MSEDFLDGEAAEHRYLVRIGVAVPPRSARQPDVSDVAADRREQYAARVSAHQGQGQHRERAEALALDDVIRPARHRAVADELRRLARLLLLVGDDAVRLRVLDAARGALLGARDDRTLRPQDVVGYVASLARRWGISL